MFSPGENDRVEGNGHGNQMNGMKATAEFVYTCGIDDKLKEIDMMNNVYTPFEAKLGSQPRGMDMNGDTIITTTVREVSEALIVSCLCSSLRLCGSNILC